MTRWHSSTPESVGMLAATRATAEPEWAELDFEFGAASMPGKKRLPLNGLPLGAGSCNQDSHFTAKVGSSFIAGIFDGVGSGNKSEWGSEEGAALSNKHVTDQLNLFSRRGELIRFLRRPELQELFRQRVEQGIVDDMNYMLWRLVPTSLEHDDRLTSIYRELDEKMFFTTLIGVVTPTWTMVLACGDGIYFVNDKPYELEARRRNMPATLAYRLCGGQTEIEEDNTLKIRHFMPTCELRSLVLGSDGLAKLGQTACPVAQGCTTKRRLHLPSLWSDDVPLASLEMRLAHCNRSATRVSAYAGDQALCELESEAEPRLDDDTSLAVIRRRGYFSGHTYQKENRSWY